MSFENKTTAFVYGTLMQGLWNERVIRNYPHKNLVALIDNVEMYDVGGFPALIKGEHTYQGELIVFDSSVNKNALYSSMDFLEGYDSSDKENSMYIRTPVTVKVSGEEVKTEVYLWNRSVEGLIYIDPKTFDSYRTYLSSKGKSKNGYSFGFY